jgi:hypothetical protein
MLCKDVLRCIFYETIKLSYEDCCTIRLIGKWISYDPIVIEAQEEWCKHESMKQLSLLKDTNLNIYICSKHCLDISDYYYPLPKYEIKLSELYVNIPKLYFQYNNVFLLITTNIYIKGKPVKEIICEKNQQKITYTFNTFFIKSFSRF